MELGEEQKVMYEQVGWDVVFLLPLGNQRIIPERSAERFLERLHDPLPFPKAQSSMPKPLLTGFI